MPAYFDSSVVLALLLNDSSADRAAALWEEYPERVSSVLLAAESLTTLRRTFKQYSRKLRADWLKHREQNLQELLKEIALQNVDEAVIQTLFEEERLSGCRSLDALHLATALFLQTGSDEPLVLCTFDETMANLAEKIGFHVRR